MFTGKWSNKACFWNPCFVDPIYSVQMDIMGPSYRKGNVIEE